MLWVPTAELRLVADSQAGVRPAAAYGTSVTPGHNTYSSYVAVLSATDEDADWIEININSIGASATATDTLVTIGVDPAGGTTYTDTISHLLATGAGPYSGSTCNGVWYRFPLRIASGSTIAAKASQNNASPSAGNVLIRLYRQSRHDIGPRIGSYVKTFGAVTATSKGTDVTPGTTDEGAWTQLGSAIGDDDHLFFWQVGFGQNSTTFIGMTTHLDLGIGDGTDNRTPILDHPIVTDGSERVNAYHVGAYAEVASGDGIYGRARVASSSNTISMIAYGVGG